MASEITYAEVRIKNESNSSVIYSGSPAAPREKPTRHLSKPGSLLVPFTSLMVLLLLLAITFLVAFIIYFQKYSQFLEEKKAIKGITHKELNCIKNVLLMEGLWDSGHRQWQWVSQTPYNASATFWHKGEPSSDDEKCVIINHLNSGWGWNDIPCSGKQQSVCQMKKIQL